MSERAAETETLRRLFRVFSAARGQGSSPVYEVLSAAVTADDDLLDMLQSAPAEQRRPSLLFAAVNLLLAQDPGAGLAAYYPIHGGLRPPDSGLAPAFSAFCAEHRGELARLLRDGSTQTNDIRRCVALRLGLDYVRRRWPGPVALVEAGASAGLNLLFDRYSYRLHGQGVTGADSNAGRVASETAAGAAAGAHGPAAGAAHGAAAGAAQGPADSKVTISCEVTAQEPPGQLIGPPPRITSRLGFDQRPVDLADPAERAWLQAFIWPEQVSELTTLRGAIDLALSDGPPAVVRADAVTDTAALLDGLPGTEPIVVFTASLLSYLAAEARAAFAAQLREAAARRRVAWVFAEAPGLLATVGLNAPALNGPLAARNSLYLVGASTRGPDFGGDDALLALADPYLRWLAPSRHPADDFRWLPA